MVEARIYDDLYGAAVDQRTRRLNEGQPTSGIKAVRIEVQKRTRNYMRALFTSLDPSAGAIAADVRYYIGRLDPGSLAQFAEAWMGALAAVTLDHIEQARTALCSTANFLTDFNEAAHMGTPIPSIKREHLVTAGEAIGRIVNQQVPGVALSFAGELSVSDKIANVVIGRGLGLKTELQGENWSPADFFSSYQRIGRIKPVVAVLTHFDTSFAGEFLLSGQRLGKIASSIENAPR